MMRWVYRSLPGPLGLRLTLFALFIVALLIALHFFYTWVGDTFLDTGGSVS